jgi:hypothetical protein
MRRVIAAVSTALVLMVSVAGPAMAAKPEIDSFEFEESFDIDCGTFLLHEEADVTVRSIVWFDGDGNAVRAVEHITYHGLITGPGGIGSLEDDGYLTNLVTIDGDDVTVRQVGLIFRFTVPGIGLVGHDVGTITFFPDDSVEYSGPHDVFEQDGVAPLICGLFED